jgi:asparagine synthase (glutamine-hydrolysing)
MCGIFGVINFNGQPVDKEKVLSARDVLAHRGPDDSGIYYSTSNQQTSNYITNIALAHRRLSIIDLSPAAHQPMTTEDGRFTIVFNGEIYNFAELREALSSKLVAVNSDKSIVNSEQFNQSRSLLTTHYSLHTKSDTEVILKLFELEGPECLKRLRGMFAFAIWDDKEKKLFAARDRFGIKPFYYLHNNRELIFSSELKAIKHYKNGLTLSMEGMDAFLKTGSVPAPLTIYEETKALLPGHWLTINNEELTIKNYFNFFDLMNVELTNQQTKLSLRGEDRRSNLHYDDNAKKIIRAALLDTIKAHMVSDVEVGAFLSGGIDSTAIVSLMRQAGHDKIKTISVTFPGNKLDESRYSNLGAKKYETDHFEYRLEEKELINDFDKIIESMDQPTIDGINTYFVSKAAASFGLKVVLSGLGGDELFGGYPSFINIPKYQRIKSIPFAKQLMKAAGLVLNGRLPAKAIEYFKNPDAPNAEYRLMRGLFTDAELTKLGWRPVVDSGSESGMTINQSYNPPDSLIENDWMIDHFSPLQYISMMESCLYMRNQLLRDSDVFSMTHSLELRVPFVDHLLYATVLPYLDNGFDKNFPKKMLVNGVGDLPDEIVHRPKQGFTFPFADWMKHGKIKDSINDSLMGSNSLFVKNEMSGLINKFNSGNLHWSRIWALYIASKYDN